MDVVMVKDFGPLLSLAATATNLEQQRKAAESKPAHGKRAGAPRCCRQWCVLTHKHLPCGICTQPPLFVHPDCWQQ